MKGSKILVIVLPTVAIMMAAYQLIYTQFLLQDPIAHRITHLGFAWTVVFLSLMLRDEGNRVTGTICVLACLVTTCYLMLFLDEILRFRTAVPHTADLIIGGLVMLLAFIGSYLLFGKCLPILAAFFLAYLVLGRYLPYPFTVAPVSIKRILVWLSTPGTEEGIYGDILAISANYLFLFIFFGSALNVFGGLRFIIGVSRWVGARFRAGPAMTALFGSSMLGTVTGSTVANITITGAYTIPLMKEAGYSPQQAGAIEAVSSNGGQIVPPIMGAAAFVMAGFAGIPYLHIMVAAIVPAVVYYFGAFVYVQLTAQKMEVRPSLGRVQGKQLLYDAPNFFAPLAVLVYLLVRGYSLPFVGFWSILTLIVVGLLNGLRKKNGLDFNGIIDGLAKGVQIASEMAVICALIGIIATCIKVSGLGMRLPLAIQDISGGHLIVALFIAMAASVMLGMGVPTVAAYLLVATGAVPALLGMGVPLLNAHLFCFIAAVFSHITPPVAIGALVASRMAQANFWPTCWEAVKAGFTAFLLPFFIIYVPILTLRSEVGYMMSIAQIAGIALGVLCLQFFLSNYCLFHLRSNERVVFLISAVCCLFFVFGRNYTSLLIVGIVLFATSLVWQFINRTRRTPGALKN